ncbi:hypothetical protein Tco_0369194 [Tanacetum coccineum]
MDNPNITMEEYIRLEEEKSRRRGKVYNWETATYVFNDALTSETTLSCEPTVSSLNDKIEFRISFDESDDEDYTVIYDKNSFSYKIISVDDLKTDLENDNDKVSMPSFPSPEPTVSYFDDLDFFKDFENELPAIVYNDALMSKSDLSTKPTLCPQHINDFDLKDEISLSEYDKEEQNVICFNDLFPFDVIYPDDSKSDKDNDDDKIDVEHSSGDLSVKSLPNVINTDDGAYAYESNKILRTSHDTSNKFFKTKTFIKEINVNIMACNYHNKGMPFIFLINNLLSIRRIQTPWIWRIDYLEVIPSLFSAQSIRSYSLNEYSVFDTGPRKRKSTNIGGEFTNLEIVKCWSLETSRRIRRIHIKRYAVYNTLVNDEEGTSFTSIRRIHQEDTAYPCMHSPKTTKDTRPIRRIQERQYAVFKLYGNKIFWKISNVVPTPRNSNTPSLDAQERKQHTSTLENVLDFEDEVLDAEVQENEATPLSDEEIALDAASQGTMASGSGGEEPHFVYDLTNYDD